MIAVHPIKSASFIEHTYVMKAGAFFLSWMAASKEAQFSGSYDILANFKYVWQI
jgi:hypothetical protein